MQTARSDQSLFKHQLTGNADHSGDTGADSPFKFFGWFCLVRGIFPPWLTGASWENWITALDLERSQLLSHSLGASMEKTHTQSQIQLNRSSRVMNEALLALQSPLLSLCSCLRVQDSR